MAGTGFVSRANAALAPPRRQDGAAGDRPAGPGGRRGARQAAVALAALACSASSIAIVAGVLAGSPLPLFDGVLIALVATAAGLLVARAQPANAVGWLLLLSALTQGLAEASLQLGLAGVGSVEWVAWPSASLRAVASMVLFVFVPLHFPDGRLPTPGWRPVRWAAIVTTASAVLWVAIRPGPMQLTTVDNPVTFEGAAQLAGALDTIVPVGLLGLLVSAFAALLVRYRRGTRTEQAQVKWLALVAGTILVAIAVSYPAESLDERLFLIVDRFVALGAAACPAVVGLALLRHHLHDVDAVISRTVVYLGLTLAVIATYVVAVVYLGALLQARGSVLVSLLATGLVAVAFSPVRERLQRAVDRLLYGDRGDPHAALDRVARQLEDVVGTDELLAVAAAEVAAALRVAYAAIEVDAPRGNVVLAAHGAPPTGPTLRIPCTAEGREVGAVIIGPIQRGELTGAEQRLLDSLLRPIGAAIHRQQLTSELARSREALVAAREEERTRLHRDLHDGLGPELATLSMLAEAAGVAVATDPARAASLLETLADRAESAVGDLRALVHGLRPPALDALGLVGAVRAHAELSTSGSTPVTVESHPLPPLSPAVEVAAYRIAVEAVTNVTRHAEATRCRVRMWDDDEGLHLEVSDDGRGLGEAVPGVGLRSMHGRAADLGGRCEVTTSPGGGTVVRAVLPAPTSAQRPVEEEPS